ncbi:MAG TPA: serine/threonine-protein kinase, partial [Nannocystaceae bacterium]|nr:serine/threonine-protein kinase [Nannocystaceae bacterium]
MVGLSRRVAELRPSTDLVQREMFGQIAASLFGEPAPPVRVDRYSILSRVGAGGMGTVFAAWDHALQRRVALKVLHREHGRAQQDRILDEARALAKLAHPNVVAVFDVGRDGDDAFIAMELVVGAPLGLHVRRTSPTNEQLARWLADAAAGLAAAHDVGLVHGDVKPSNLLLGDDDRVRVIDFGLAIAAGASARGGTAGYLAPEVEQGAAPSAASDVYALCVAADELVAPSRWPRRLRRAIARGRADDPRARGTMSDLLAAFRSSARASSHRRVLATTVLVGLGLFALGSTPTSRCPLPIDSQWHEGLRARAEQAFAGHGERGAFVWSAVAGPLDRRASAWLDARDAACALPPTTRDPIAACLDDHAVGLEATVEQLERGGPLPRVDRVLAA